MSETLDVKPALLEPLETAVVPATSAPLVIRDLAGKVSGVKFSMIFGEFKDRSLLFGANVYRLVVVA